MSRLLAASLALSLSTGALAGPKLVVVGPTEIDFGDVLRGDKVWAEVGFRNTGNRELRLRFKPG